MSDAREKQSDVRIRRAPKFPTFLILGGGVGAIGTFIATALYPVDPAVGFGALFGYFALYGVTGGVILGALIAIILDRRADRHATTGSVVIESTEPAPQSPDEPAHYEVVDPQPRAEPRANPTNDTDIR